MNAAEAEARGAQDLKSLLADEPDLSVRTAPSRFTAAGASTGRAGSEGLNIRGLEGNQVLMLVDGIRVPSSFSFAAFSTGRATICSSTRWKSAEVLRGPASTPYGSDGLAGVLSLRTLDPQDILGRDRALGGFVRLGYAQVDAGTRASAGIAGRGAALVLARRGQWRLGPRDREPGRQQQPQQHPHRGQPGQSRQPLAAGEGRARHRRQPAPDPDRRSQ